MALDSVTAEVVGGIVGGDSKDLGRAGCDINTGKDFGPLLDQGTGAGVAGIIMKCETHRDIGGQVGTAAVVYQGNRTGDAVLTVIGAGDIQCFGLYFDIRDIHKFIVGAVVVVGTVALADSAGVIGFDQNGNTAVAGIVYQVGGKVLGRNSKYLGAAAGSDVDPGKGLAPLQQLIAGTAGVIEQGKPHRDIGGQVGAAAGVGHGDGAGYSYLPIRITGNPQRIGLYLQVRDIHSFVIRAVGIVRAVAFADGAAVIGFHPDRDLAVGGIIAEIGVDSLRGDSKYLGAAAGCHVDRGKGPGPLVDLVPGAAGIIKQGESHGNIGSKVSPAAVVHQGDTAGQGDLVIIGAGHCQGIGLYFDIGHSHGKGCGGQGIVGAVAFAQSNCRVQGGGKNAGAGRAHRGIVKCKVGAAAGGQVNGLVGKSDAAVRS